MQSDVLSAFFDEAETGLTAVRGGLLVFARGVRDRTTLRPTLTVVRSLRGTASLLEQADLETALERLQTGIAEVAEGKEEINEEDITGLLDSLVATERILGDLQISAAGFGSEIEELVDRTFDQVLARTSIPSEDTADGPAADEFDPSDIDPELREVFAGEADFLLQSIEDRLAGLNAGGDRKEELWEIKRHAHTFKGASGIVGLKLPSRLAHKIEDVLERVADRPAAALPQLVSVLRRATVVLRGLTTVEPDPKAAGEAEGLMRELETMATGSMDVAAIPTASSTSEPPPPSDETVPRSERRALIRIPLDSLDPLVAASRQLAADCEYTGTSLRELEDQVGELRASTERLRDACLRIWKIASAVGVAGDPIKLRMDIYEASVKVMETVGDADAVSEAIDVVRGDLRRRNDRERALASDVEARLIAARQVPLASLQNRLRRAVTVTCEEESKQASVSIEGDDVTIDAMVADKLIEPLIHLMKNAVVHGVERPEMRRLLGKPEVGSINIRGRIEDERLVLEVSDDGQGIDFDALKRKAVDTGHLEPDDATALSADQVAGLIFLRGLTTAEKLNLSAGRGVGMGIVKESVEAAGGTVSVSSVLRKGTTFTVRMPLPFIKEVPSAVKAIDAVSRSTHDRPDLLLVDDSPSVRHATAKIASDAGFSVETARDGLEAIEKLASLVELPAMILTDLEMPRMDGFEMVRKIRATESLRHIPVVFMTSRSSDQNMATAAVLGARDYLVKPCEPDRLRAILDAVLVPRN